MQLIPVATKMTILQPNIGVGQGIIPSSDLSGSVTGLNPSIHSFFPR
jgi:hypothetical protein